MNFLIASRGSNVMEVIMADSPQVIFLDSGLNRWSRHIRRFGLDPIQPADLDGPGLGPGSVYHPNEYQLDQIYQMVESRGEHVAAIVIGNNRAAGVTVARHIQDLGYTEKTWIIWNRAPSNNDVLPYRVPETLAKHFSTRTRWMEDLQSMMSQI